MRWIPKLLLWLIAMVIPVFIAACYGPQQRYRASGLVDGPGVDRKLTGRVVDAGTQKALEHIDVFCLDQGQVRHRAMTDAAGRYWIPGHLHCDELQFGDGREGLFKPRTVPVSIVAAGEQQVSLERAE